MKNRRQGIERTSFAARSLLKQQKLEDAWDELELGNKSRDKVERASEEKSDSAISEVNSQKWHKERLLRKRGR